MKPNNSADLYEVKLKHYDFLQAKFSIRAIIQNLILYVAYLYSNMQT